MDFKQKHNYLMGYRRKMAQIESDTVEYERWVTIGAKMTQAFNAAPPSSCGSSSRVEKSGIELMEIYDKLQREIQEALRCRDRIRKVINERAKKPRYAELLRWRYISGMTNAKIAEMIGKSEKTVSHAMVRAIETLDL